MIPGNFVTVAVVVILTLFTTVSGAQENSRLQSQIELPQPDIPQPQFFCGNCHILTYPGIIQKGHQTWEESKHNKSHCVECHYPDKEGADEGPGQVPWTGEVPAERIHIPEKLQERFSYVQLGGETVKTRSSISDANCVTNRCHGKADDDFKTKKIEFAEKKVSYIHEPHLDKNKQIEGQQVHCTSCHQHETERKHFEVSKASCSLCHFKNTKFNEGRGKCVLCHALPEKPIQTSGDNPITHQMLQDAKVLCASCHIELIQASSGSQYEVYFENGELKTALVIGAGRIKKENCLACHDQEKEIEEADKKKLMHEKHVTKKNARCLDCHQPIKHAKAELNQPEPDGHDNPHPDQPMLFGCVACHPDPHRYQVLLAAGPERKGVLKSPDPMYNARTNCLGCHLEEGVTDKGQKVVRSSAKPCVRCHTKDHEKMFKDWQTELAKEIKFAKEVEQEAMEALAKRKAELSESKIAEAMKMLDEGRENLRIVLFGNGVHNKKYAMMLIDATVTSFEDAVYLLEEGSE
jgi:hypothetical protein